MDSTSYHRFLVKVLTPAALAAMLCLPACSKRYSDLPAFSSLPVLDSANNSVGRFKTTYLAQQIHAFYRGEAPGPIAVTTFVNLDNLYQTSSFGRVLSEQLISELSMLGYDVIEIRHSRAVQVHFDSGEFGLSRELGMLKDNRELAGIVVGTYSVSPERVYLNARILDPSSSQITSVGSVEMKKTEEITQLLRPRSLVPLAFERVPVRSLGAQSNYLPYQWPFLGSYSEPHGEDMTREPVVVPALPPPLKESGKGKAKS